MSRKFWETVFQPFYPMQWMNMKKSTYKKVFIFGCIIFTSITLAIFVSHPGIITGLVLFINLLLWLFDYYTSGLSERYPNGWLYRKKYFRLENHIPEELLKDKEK